MKLTGIFVAAFIAAVMSSFASAAPNEIRLGFISPQSRQGGNQGVDMLNAFRLGLEHTGNKLGGLPVKLFTGDDQAKPEVGVQLARQMMERDKIHIMSGLLYSHVSEAVLSTVLPTGRFVMAVSGGETSRAGKNCQPNYFLASWIIASTFQEVGAYLAKEGVKRVAVITNNYAAGWDVVSGVKRGYGKDLVAEVLVTLGQSDYGAEISRLRAANPEVIVEFLPGAPGAAFLLQLKQSGLREAVKIYTQTTIADVSTFKATGDAAIDLVHVGNWSENLDNAANRKFVEAYREQYGETPSILAAMAYDTVLLLNAAVTAVNGDVENSDAFREALRNVKYDSIRGYFAFNNNHFPIQNYYLNRVSKTKSGELKNDLLATLTEAGMDQYHQDCPMK
ncbi:ABC transporter substrate-binding protein [Bradyrhizobium sp. NP1]|uniref:ABC transporter substrate-binding protein n=1 Tax=Bradyrhizobium sp. NP1 TaxID=3049772 RepID=UPI0025A515ED|nr:ABC transporter substrate-binding protein [Bradyrhizobium sp. NP1]WJR76870.1 ABC transporter substrate-binding protein [Bradyrhizobium sp. NP1]